MNQTEHNVKIKSYKKNLQPSPFVKTVHLLDQPRNYPAQQEQERMIGRFKELHWERQNVLPVKGHKDRMFILQSQEQETYSKQAREIADVQDYRRKHLQGIKDNIDQTRERFWRRSELNRQINQDEHYSSRAAGLEIGGKTLYKIINDGVPTRY